jgi:hypothetical protein
VLRAKLVIDIVRRSDWRRFFQRTETKLCHLRWAQWTTKICKPTANKHLS